MQQPTTEEAQLTPKKSVSIGKYGFEPIYRRAGVYLPETFLDRFRTKFALVILPQPI